jgi:hypothetical protein
VPGGFTCTCRADLGYSGSGTQCADSEPPTLKADAALVSDAAAPNVTHAAVKFPTLTPADNASPVEAIVVTCKAALTKDGEPVPVKGKADGVTDATEFPVGTTIVVCTAMDEKGLVSLPVSFTVVVTCAAGYALRGGACVGEPSAFRGGAPWDLPGHGLVPAIGRLCSGPSHVVANARPAPLAPLPPKRSPRRDGPDAGAQGRDPLPGGRSRRRQHGQVACQA